MIVRTRRQDSTPSLFHGATGLRIPSYLALSRSVQSRTVRVFRKTALAQGKILAAGTFLQFGSRVQNCSMVLSRWEDRRRLTVTHTFRRIFAAAHSDAHIPRM